MNFDHDQIVSKLFIVSMSYKNSKILNDAFFLGNVGLEDIIIDSIIFNDSCEI